MEIDLSIKGLLSPLIQPMGPFYLPGGPFHCCEKSICEKQFKVGALSNSILRMGSCIFAVNRDVSCDCLKQMIHPPRETIPFLVVSVCLQLSVDTDTSHNDRIASSFLHSFTKSISGIKTSSI